MSKVDLEAAEKLAHFLSAFPNHPHRQATKTIRDLVAECRRLAEVEARVKGLEQEIRMLPNDYDDL